MVPPQSRTGIKVMSVNLLLPDETDPVAWRGPVIAGCVKQFWTDVNWGENDTMYIDMPPGTGDVPLTVFQSIPVDGMVIVTSPQELVSMIVEKAVKLAGLMNIPEKRRAARSPLLYATDNVYNAGKCSAKPQQDNTYNDGN